jgi:hypothetical protein
MAQSGEMRFDSILRLDGFVKFISNLNKLVSCWFFITAQTERNPGGICSFIVRRTVPVLWAQSVDEHVSFFYWFFGSQMALWQKRSSLN